MEIGNFGAVLRFALELEAQTIAFYETAVEKEELFRPLIQEGKKRLQRLERARREGVVEMVLEPITGLDGDAYSVEPAPGAEDETEYLDQAIVLENVMARFYRDAADKMPIKGVARLFERLARENEQHKAQLEADLSK